MATRSSSASSSKETHKTQSFNLRSYVGSEDQMLPIHKIEEELMPAVLNHLSKLKSSIPETDKSLRRHFDTIKSDLIDVRDAIGRLNDLERRLNVQMKELVLLDLDGISKELDSLLKDSQRAAVMDSLRSEESGELSDNSLDSSDNPPSEHLIPVDQIQKQLSELKENAVPKLKETLNLIARISPSDNEETNIPPPPPPNPVESVETSFAVSLDGHPLFSKMSDSLAFIEIWMLFGSLNTTLQKCLLCLTAFPDGSVVNKRVLVYWWIGEGFIESPDKADEFLMELMAKGFVEPVYRKRYPVAHRYKIHPFIRSLLLVLAQKVGFFFIGPAGDFLESAEFYKACLVRTEQGSSQHTLRDCPDDRKINMETLFNVNESYLDLQSHWFSKLKKFRVLQLGRWESSAKRHIEVGNTEFLKNLSNMKNLRYLSLQGISGIAELPVSLSNFPDMRVLDLRACHNLQKLPNGIGKLKNLTHLDMSECYLISHMPPEVASLSKLLVLKGFVIGDTKNTGDVCKFTDLLRLKYLRKLSLYIFGDANSTKDELFNNLPSFTALLSLTIAWVGAQLPATKTPRLLKRLSSLTLQGRRRTTESTATTITTLPLEWKLEKLDLRGFPWSRLTIRLDPMKLTHLKKLYIRGGELCDLHRVDSPWEVQILRLKYLCKLGMSWEKLQASFPNMTYLEKMNCPKLSLFPCDGNGVWMRKSLN